MYAFLKIHICAITGPREPLFFVPTTPERSPTYSDTSMSIFSQETILLESDSDEGDSTVSLADKMGKQRKYTPFKFKSLEELNKIRSKYSPTSSPIPLPSPQKCEISSDEDLENYMIELEESVNKNSE